MGCEKDLELEVIPMTIPGKIYEIKINALIQTLLEIDQKLFPEQITSASPEAEVHIGEAA